MNNVVYKYILPVFNGGNPEQIPVEMPIGAQIFKIHMQGEDLTIWAGVDKKQQATETRYFVVAGTGVTLPVTAVPLAYWDTVFVGAFVFHIFEREW